MRLLVTGGAGFIGSFLCERFLSAGHQVRVLDNFDPQVHPDGVHHHLPPQVDLRRGDVRDRAACESAIDGIDVVVHGAAAVGVAQSLYRIEHFVDVNVRGAATLLQCVVDRRPPVSKIVVLTSMTAYGEGLYRRGSDGRTLRVGIRSEEQIGRWGWEPVCPEIYEPLEPIPTPEDAALMARNIYALTKRSQEDLALSLGSVYRIPAACLRLFNVYGPRQSLSNPYSGVLAIFLSRLLAGQPPVVYEDGKQTRDFVSVHDVAEAIVVAIESTAAEGEVVNIGSGIARSIGEIARTLARLIGRPEIEPTITGQYRRGDVRHCTADLTRARRLLGFEPKIQWEDGLAELIQWARETDSTDRFLQADQELRRRALLAEVPEWPGACRA